MLRTLVASTLLLLCASYSNVSATCACLAQTCAPAQCPAENTGLVQEFKIEGTTHHIGDEVSLGNGRKIKVSDAYIEQSTGKLTLNLAGTVLAEGDGLYYALDVYDSSHQLIEAGQLEPLLSVMPAESGPDPCASFRKGCDPAHWWSCINCTAVKYCPATDDCVIASGFCINEDLVCGGCSLDTAGEPPCGLVVDPPTDPAKFYLMLCQSGNPFQWRCMVRIVNIAEQ